MSFNICIHIYICVLFIYIYTPLMVPKLCFISSCTEGFLLKGFKHWSLRLAYPTSQAVPGFEVWAQAQLRYTMGGH